MIMALEPSLEIEPEYPDFAQNLTFHLVEYTVAVVLTLCRLLFVLPVA